MKIHALTPAHVKNFSLNEILIILRSINTLMGKLCISNEYKWPCANVFEQEKEGKQHVSDLQA